MGFLDFLFRRSRRAPVAPAPGETDEADTDDEQTTFVSLTLSPRAQACMKQLRDLQYHGETRYRWVTAGAQCPTCAQFAAGGPYEIAAGLARKAPVPGRESKCECDSAVEAAS